MAEDNKFVFLRQAKSLKGGSSVPRRNFDPTPSVLQTGVTRDSETKLAAPGLGDHTSDSSLHKQLMSTVNSAVAFGKSLGKRGGTRKAKGGRGKRGAPSLPPQIELVTSYEITRRYGNTSASSAAVTRATLGSIAGLTCVVVNTTVQFQASSFRILKITVWPPAGGSCKIMIPSITTGAEQALSKESSKNSSIPTGITVDKPVVYVPKRGTYQAMWQNIADNPNDQLYAISSDAGAVMDVHVVVTAAGAVSAPYQHSTSSTISVGTIGVGSLDTSNKFFPVGYTQIDW